jgi:hypothetical protein
MRRLIFALAAFFAPFALAAPAHADDVIIRTDDFTLGFSDRGVHVYGVHDKWRGRDWHGRDWRDERKHRRHKKHHGYGYGYGHGGWDNDWRRDDWRRAEDCRRVEDRVWSNGRPLIISEVLCTDRYGRTRTVPGTREVREDHYYGYGRGW